MAVAHSTTTILLTDASSSRSYRSGEQAYLIKDRVSGDYLEKAIQKVCAAVGTSHRRTVMKRSRPHLE